MPEITMSIDKRSPAKDDSEESIDSTLEVDTQTTSTPASLHHARSAPDSAQPKRKGGRKPIYATSEERKQRNRQAQAAFRERRTEYIRQLEQTIRVHETNLQNLQSAHRTAADECLMLRYKNSLLERILLEKGIDVQAELHAKTGEMSSTVTSEIDLPVQRAPSLTSLSLPEQEQQQQQQQFNPLLLRTSAQRILLKRGQYRDDDVVGADTSSLKTEDRSQTSFPPMLSQSGGTASAATMITSGSILSPAATETISARTPGSLPQASTAKSQASPMGGRPRGQSVMPSPASLRGSYHASPAYPGLSEMELDQGFDGATSEMPDESERDGNAAVSGVNNGGGGEFVGLASSHHRNASVSSPMDASMLAAVSTSPSLPAAATNLTSMQQQQQQQQHPQGSQASPSLATSHTNGTTAPVTDDGSGGTMTAGLFAAATDGTGHIPMLQLLDSSGLDWDPFGLSASMAFPSTFPYEQNHNLR